HVRIAFALRGHVTADRRRRRRPALDRQRAALAKVVLDIHDHQRTHTLRLRHGAPTVGPLEPGSAAGPAGQPAARPGGAAGAAARPLSTRRGWGGGLGSGPARGGGSPDAGAPAAPQTEPTAPSSRPPGGRGGRGGPPGPPPPMTWPVASRTNSGSARFTLAA